MRDNISSVVEFWEAVKANPMNQFNTLQQQSESLKYTEFACKCIRRMMEGGSHTFEEINDLLNNIKHSNEEDLSPVNNKISERLECLTQDIVRKQRKRFQLLEEKVKELQEAHTGALGAKNVDFVKL